MGYKTRKVIAGAVGGMVGGLAMAGALAALQRSSLARKSPLIGTSYDYEEGEDQSIGKHLAVSALLGGVYGGLRSALNLPGMLSGPLYGMASYGLSLIGLGPAMERTPGPWNKGSMAVLPRLMTHTVYGMVTDVVSERMERMLA